MIFARARQLDTVALHSALDARRLQLGMTWRLVAEQTGVAASTLQRTAGASGPMEADGILSMFRWLDRMPEDFMRGAGAAVPLGPKRFQTRVLYLALDTERQRRGATWVQVAREIGGVSPAMLRHLAGGGRVDIEVAVAASRWLGVSVGSFTH